MKNPVNIGAWRSLEARLLWEQEVPSSNLGAPTNKINNLRDADFHLKSAFLRFIYPTGILTVYIVLSEASLIE